MRERTARCGCGQLTARVTGEPIEVYACSCRNCQRESGTAFTYVAIYPESAVATSGAHKVWRRTVESGRWLEDRFCPTCGGTVASCMQVWPEAVAVAVGCFADPDFAQPERLYWASRRHRWLQPPEGTELLDTQLG